MFVGALAMAGVAAAATDDPVAHGPGYSRVLQPYQAPAVQLVRGDGKPVDFAVELDDGRPVVLTFIYTTCTTVCPVVTQVLARLQSRLGAERERVSIALVTIDPENDTPARLAAYGREHGADAQWRFYTGTEDASVAVQKAFGVYAGDKMSHVPVTLMRAAPGKPWLRLEGFVTPDELAQELDRLRAG
jgi:protein SCO1/2